MLPPSNTSTTRLTLLFNGITCNCKTRLLQETSHSKSRSRTTETSSLSTKQFHFPSHKFQTPSILSKLASQMPMSLIELSSLFEGKPFLSIIEQISRRKTSTTIPQSTLLLFRVSIFQRHFFTVYPLTSIHCERHFLQENLFCVIVCTRALFLNSFFFPFDSLFTYTACVSLSNCESCVTTNIAFECRWCDATQKCSDGFDRHRQDWLSKKCDTDSHSKETPNRCKFIPTTTSSSKLSPNSNPGSAKSKTDHDGYSIHDHDSEASHASHASSSKVGALFFLILIAFVGGIGMWVFYAYKNPQTGAGQFLIKYRPAEWRWNNGADTRYTAASIHM